MRHRHLALLLLVPISLAAQGRDSVVPDLAALVARPQSELAPVLERWSADRAALGRRYSVEYSPERRDRFRSFQHAWQVELQRLPFEQLSRPAQVDYLLLDNKLRYELALLDREEMLAAEMAPLLPFANALFALLGGATSVGASRSGPGREGDHRDDHCHRGRSRRDGDACQAAEQDHRAARG